MQNETLFTIRWLAGIRLRNGKTNTIVREAADSVVFTVAESALNGTPPEAEANAGVAELDLGSGLHLCLLLFKAVPNPSAKLLNLYGQLNGNWIVAGASNTEPVNRLVPQNSIPLDQQAKTELLETSFIDWNGEEYQYEVFSQFEVLPRGAAALTTSKPLQFKPVGEAQKCIGNYPKVVINHMNDIQSKPLSQQ